MAACSDASPKNKNEEPLLIFYDSEAANSNVHYGDIIEIAATCHPGVVVGSFGSFVDTKQQLCSFALHKSSISKQDLIGKPTIEKVVQKFLDWVKEMVSLASEKNKARYFPVICAHGGYQFDFLILFSNLERKGFPYKNFADLNVHFADSFLFCKELQDRGNPYLQDTKLSIDGLFYKFFPKHTIKGRHRAMGDVKAMIKIFTQTSLTNELHLMKITSTQERIDYYISQSSRKLQQRILEEKMASLDACSRNMCTKTLIREGLTYDVLKTVFQQCSSYMDFWQTLKNFGIERRVAKHFTNQFGAMGLQNEGALGYCLDITKQNGAALPNGLGFQGKVEAKHSSPENYFASTTSRLNSHNTELSNQPSIDIDNGEDSIGSSSQIVHESKSLPVNSDKSINDSYHENSLATVRSVSSSQAFKQRPMDYALTSSSDQVRPRICDANGHVRELKNSKHELKDSPSEIESTGNPSMSGNLEESSNENESENWDSEISTSMSNNEQFVLKINSVIPVSVGIEDFSSDKSYSQHKNRYAPKCVSISEKTRVKDTKKDCVNQSQIRHGGESIGKKNASIEDEKEVAEDATALKYKTQRNVQEMNATKEKCKDAMLKEQALSESIIDNAKNNKHTQVKTIKSTKEGEKNQNRVNKKESKNDNKETASIKSPASVMPVDATANDLIVNEKTCTKNKKEKSKRKRNKQNVRKGKSVVFVHLPESSDFEGKAATTFFVGDVEIRVPLESSCTDLDLHVRDKHSKSCHDNGRDIQIKATDKSSHQMPLCDSDQRALEGDEITLALPKDDNIPLSCTEHDGECKNVEINYPHALKTESSKNEDDLKTCSASTDTKFQGALTVAGDKAFTSYCDEVIKAPENTHINDGNGNSNARTEHEDQYMSPEPPQGSKDAEGDTNSAYSVNVEENNENRSHYLENDGLIPGECSGTTAVDQHEQPLQEYDAQGGNYPSMYPMQPLPYGFTAPYPSGIPTGVPTGVPAGYNFYPHMGPMMPMLPGPTMVSFPGLAYPGQQGFVPFGGLQHRYALPGQVYQQPTIYHQQEPSSSLTYVGQHDALLPQNMNRKSPDTLGIPCTEVDPTITTTPDRNSLACDSFSSTSDETNESPAYIGNEGNVSLNIAISDSPSPKKERGNDGNLKDHEYGKCSVKERQASTRGAVSKAKTDRCDKEREDQSTNHLKNKSKGEDEKQNTVLSMSSRETKGKLPNIVSYKNEAKYGSPKSASCKPSDEDSPSSKKPSPKRETGKYYGTSKSPISSKNEMDKDPTTTYSSTSDIGESPYYAKVKSPRRQSDDTGASSKDQKEIVAISKRSDNVVVTKLKSSPTGLSRKSTLNQSSPNNADERKRSQKSDEIKVSSTSATFRYNRTREDDMRYKYESNNKIYASSKSSSNCKRSATEPNKPALPLSFKDELTKDKRSQLAEHYHHQKRHRHNLTEKSENALVKTAPHEKPILQGSKLDVSPSSKSNDAGIELEHQNPSKKAEGVYPKSALSTSRGESSTSQSKPSSNVVTRMKPPISSPRKIEEAPSKSTNQRQSNKASLSRNSVKSSDIGCYSRSESNRNDICPSRTDAAPPRGSENESSKSDVPKPDLPLKFIKVKSNRGTKDISQDSEGNRIKKELIKPTVSNSNAPDKKPKQKDENWVTFSLPNQTNEAARKLKWPLSAWSGGTIKVAPRPQRDPLARKRIRESQSKFATGSLSKEGVSESLQNIPGTRPNMTSNKVFSKVQPSVSSKDVIDDSVTTGSARSCTKHSTSEKVQKSSARTVNYRDILVGKTDSTLQDNLTIKSKTQEKKKSSINDEKDCKKSDRSVIKPTKNSMDRQKCIRNSPINGTGDDTKLKDKDKR